MTLPRCLWATSQPWSSPFRVSAHHYAGRLADRGWDVAFLSHPVSPLHLLWSRSRSGTRERIRNWRRGGETARGGRLYHYCPLTLCPPHDAPGLRGAGVLDFWPKLTVPSLRRRLAVRGFDRVDLLVIDSERYAFLLDAVPAGTTVFRVVDAIGGFDATPPSWIRRTHALMRRVDHVVATSQVVADELRGRSIPRVHVVPNGVDTDRFAQNVSGTPVEPPIEYRSLDSPRAVYVGAIESWLDVDLVRAVADALPHIGFVLVGPIATSVETLRSLANVHLLGARPYESVPQYLVHADVGIIPFRGTALTRSINPIKLYEYLACGLPVVATRSDELEQLDSPARLCRTVTEFVREVAEATEHPVDREPLVAFARGADWRIRTARLLDVIGCGDLTAAVQILPGGGPCA